MNKKTITQFVTDRNFDKKLFTAGPASLVDENLSGLMPCLKGRYFIHGYRKASFIRS